MCDMHACPILTQNVSDMIDPLRELISVLDMRQRMPQNRSRCRRRRPHSASFSVIWIRCRPRIWKSCWLLAEHTARIFGFSQKDRKPLMRSIRRMKKLGLELTEFGVRIAFKPTDFTQVNHALNETMGGCAVRLLGLEPDHKQVADFFCGLGNFTLPLARCSQRVIGIEGSEGLVARARQGAAENGLAEKTTFRARNLLRGANRTGKSSGRPWAASTAC